MAAVIPIFKMSVMKSFFKILIHPVTICLFFSFLIISGESSAAFYIIALVFGGMDGALHSIIGIAGILILLSSIFFTKGYRRHILDMLGVVCIIISLVLFFIQPGGSYNYNTFRESVPLIIMIVFSIILLLNLFYHLSKLRKPYQLS